MTAYIYNKKTELVVCIIKAKREFIKEYFYENYDKSAFSLRYGCKNRFNKHGIFAVTSDAKLVYIW